MARSMWLSASQRGGLTAQGQMARNRYPWHEASGAMNVTLSVRELLLSGTEDAFAELRRRGVLRSHASNPTGDVAEWIVAQQLGVVLAPPG